MRKTHRLTLRTSEELRDRLAARAMESGRDSMSKEAHIILEKALGIKRAKPERKAAV